jgi:spore germination protein GerM
MAASKRNNNKRSGSNAGTVFWLAAILIALFLFALNWGKIQETLARTNFHEIVKTQTGNDANPGPQAKAAPQTKGEPSKSPVKPGAPEPEPQASTTKVVPKSEPEATPKTMPQGASPGDEVDASQPTPKGAASSAATSVTDTRFQSSPQTKGAKPTPTAAQVARSRAASLYFVRIDDDGVIVRQEVKRQISVSDSPLLDSLDALLKGPNEDELRHKLISLVPAGTKLLSAQVKGSTAVLNFNEAFMYNHYGIEGYAGQLKQIVFTATSFPNVQDVQILIEGEKHDYLGGEGVYIGRPLSRSSF